MDYFAAFCGAGGLVSVIHGLQRVTDNAKAETFLKECKDNKSIQVNSIFKYDIKKIPNDVEFSIDEIFGNHIDSHTYYVNTGNHRHPGVSIPISYNTSENQLLMFDVGHSESVVVKEINKNPSLMRYVDSEFQSSKFMADWRKHPSADFIAQCAHNESIKLESVTLKTHQFKKGPVFLATGPDHIGVATLMKVRPMIDRLNPSGRYLTCGLIGIIGCGLYFYSNSKQHKYKGIYHAD